MVYHLHLYKFLVKLTDSSVICGWKQGQRYEWDDNGKLLLISNYVNNKFHGKYFVWHVVNGKIHSINNWINDKQHGKCYRLYSNGKLFSISNWINDKRYGNS